MKKEEIIVIGAKSHAKVCVELLHAMGNHVAYCVGAEDSSETCIGIQVLKGDENLQHLHSKGYYRVFVAIGDNQLRARLALFATQLGYQLVNAISPQAIISPTVKLGVGIAIMAGVVINAEATISDLVIINTGATIDHDCQIGQAVHIAPQCGLAGNVTVGRQSMLGIGSKIIPQITIGENVIVGAGGVVVEDINNNLTVVGVPARVISQRIKRRKRHKNAEKNY